jgi:hypothetical protein
MFVVWVHLVNEDDVVLDRIMTSVYPTNAMEPRCRRNRTRTNTYEVEMIWKIVRSLTQQGHILDGQSSHSYAVLWATLEASRCLEEGQ